MDNSVLQKAKYWTSEVFDEQTRKAVAEMIENNPEQLNESFYKDLEFGTGGLRGIMGAGTNRMNRYTVGMATQGLANYLLAHCDKAKGISCAIAHDSRNNSREFAKITASVLSANGIKVYLFDKLRPTPELSFAIRHSPALQFGNRHHRFAQPQGVQRLQGLLERWRSGNSSARQGHNRGC